MSTLSELIALAKEAADLTNVTDYVTESTWISWINAATVELHRLVTNKFQATYYREFDFTIVAPDSQIALPAALAAAELPAFWRLKGLDIDADTPRRREVRPYNFAERNRFRQNTLRDLTTFCNDRVYNLPGSSILKIQAEEQAAGNYRLYYVPKPGILALPITVDFNIDASDSPSVPPTGGLAGTGSWGLLNSALNDLIPVDGSVDLTLTFNSPNDVFNGPYPIVDIGLVSGGFGRPTAGVSNLVSTAGFTGPAVGTGTYTYQAIGTVNEIDAELEPYEEYVWLTAARKSLMKEESFAQANMLKDQINLIRADLETALDVDSGGPATVIDTDRDEGYGW